MLQGNTRFNISASTIPAEDVSRQYLLIEEELHQAINRVLPTGRYVLGPELVAFEQNFAAFCGTRYAIGVSNGTDALHLALIACGIGPGDEVITVPNTYIATVFAITYVGAIPVFVDIQPDTYNINSDLLEAAITERTRAIIPVHLYGQPCEMEPILAIAHKYGLRVIEDTAHAHGAYYHDSPAGSFGDVGCFSFYPTKAFGAFGDAGAIVTNDSAIDTRLRQLRYMGQKVKHHHEVIGYQKRMDELQAAILNVKLPHLSDWIARRQAIAVRYQELLSGTPLVLPYVAPGRTHAYYLYTVLAPRRDELRNYLTEQGIGTQVIYPILVPDQIAYQDQPIRCGPIPVARSLLGQLLCLPMFPELRDDEVDRVAAAIVDFYSGSHQFNSVFFGGQLASDHIRCAGWKWSWDSRTFQCLTALAQLQENDPAGIVAIMDRLGLPHSPRANELTRSDVVHVLETLRERTLADERWYGVIHECDITTNFIERVTSSLEYA